MRSSVSTAVAFICLVVAEFTLADPLPAPAIYPHRRQGPTPSASLASASTPSASLVSTPATTFTFSLKSTNPTAAPLSVIRASASSIATIPLSATPSAGAQPTYTSNVPSLPNLASVSPRNYPPLDQGPPVSSSEVQQWIQEVQNSGVSIPNIPPTVLGGCPSNTAAAADQSRCWWYCGGCTRSSDITDCPTALDWGLTYDDGPAFYTPNLLDYLDQQNLKSTFFVVGSRVISFPAMLQSEYMRGHQIAVHTWSHPYLTTLSNEAIIAELGWTKKVIKDVLGVTPNMMRPPYGDIDDRVRAISIAMGLTPVIWSRISPSATFDTGDFYVHSGLTSVQQVLYNWQNIVGNATSRSDGFIVLEHDLYLESVEIATGYILPDALAHQPAFNIKPVITCLNKPMWDAYIETNDNKTNPPPYASGAVASLSSGAPGSVQATGRPKQKSSAIGFSVTSDVVTLATLVLLTSVGAILL